MARELRNTITRVGPDWFIEIPEGQTTQETYEVAAWYRTIKLEPGKYKLEWKPEQYRGHWVTTIPGTVIDAYFPALFGGVAYTDGKRPNEIGKPASHHVRIDDYAIKENETYVEAPDHLRIVLFYLESVELGIRTRDWDTHDNKEHWNRQIRSLNDCIKLLEQERDSHEKETWGD